MAWFWWVLIGAVVITVIILLIRGFLQCDDYHEQEVHDAQFPD